MSQGSEVTELEDKAMQIALFRASVDDPYTFNAYLGSKTLQAPDSYLEAAGLKYYLEAKYGPYQVQEAIKRAEQTARMIFPRKPK